DVSGFGNLVNRTVEITTGPGTGQFRLITATVAADVNTILTLNAPWQTLPNATSTYAIITASLNFFVNEDDQVDTLTVFNTNSVAEDAGTLTDTRLTGLGMGNDVVIGGETKPGGITYHNLEALTVNLGSGNDQFLILDTHAGTTTVNTARGNDTVNVRKVSGQTTLSLGDGADTVNVGTLAPVRGGGPG